MGARCGQDGGIDGLSAIPVRCRGSLSWHEPRGGRALWLPRFPPFSQPERRPDPAAGFGRSARAPRGSQFGLGGDRRFKSGAGLPPERLIQDDDRDVNMEPLPYIDEHSQRFDTPTEVVWASLLRVLRRQMGGSETLARVLGCDPARGTAEFSGNPGEAVPGFLVVAAEPGRRLALRGRHRFANYTLTFLLDGDLLRAQTHAEFPGIAGRLYRAAVIGSGAHRWITRRLLRQVARA